MHKKTIKIEYLPVNSLRPNPWNSNVVSADMEVRIASSLTEIGFYKPIIVRTTLAGELEILGGEHRWNEAKKLGHETVPVVNLGYLDDKEAKAISLVDNGSYGHDNSEMLRAVLSDLGAEYANLLPYDDTDLAGIMATGMTIDLDTLGLDPTEITDISGKASAERPDPERKATTHELLRARIPVEHMAKVTAAIDLAIVQYGLSAEEDRAVAVGMALVEMIKAAK